MRTERALLTAAAVAAVTIATLAARPASAEEAGRWIAQLDGEASVVGASFGVRGELLWRIGAPGTASHLRASAGFLPGPELTFVPAGLGYRAIWRSTRTVQPFAGGGWESQHFLISDAPTVHRWLAIYLEGGSGFALTPQLSLGLGTSLDFSILRSRGPGLQLRGFAAWRF